MWAFSSTAAATLVAASNAQVGYILGGVQYKYHTDTFSPFVRVFLGTSRIDPALTQAEWNVALGGGGGFDLNMGHRFAIRLAQVDYIYSNYNAHFLAGRHPVEQHSPGGGHRLESGQLLQPATDLRRVGHAD